MRKEMAMSMSPALAAFPIGSMEVRRNGTFMPAQWAIVGGRVFVSPEIWAELGAVGNGPLDFEELVRRVAVKARKRRHAILMKAFEGRDRSHLGVTEGHGGGGRAARRRAARRRALLRNRNRVA